MTDIVAWIVVPPLILVIVLRPYWRNRRVLLFMAALPFHPRRLARFASYLWRGRHARLPDGQPDPRADVYRSVKRAAWNHFTFWGGLLAFLTALGQFLGNGNLVAAMVSAAVALVLFAARNWPTNG